MAGEADGEEIIMWHSTGKLVVMLTLSVLMVLLAAAQQRSTVPRIGILNSGTPAESQHLLAAFRQGLRE